TYVGEAIRGEGCGTALGRSRFGAGLSADEELDRIADANRSGNRAHGAERTAPAEERLPEHLAIGNAKELADVRARLAGAVDPQSHASDTELAVDRQLRDVRKAFDRDLL